MSKLTKQLAVSERILSLKKRIGKLEVKYSDICEYAGEWSMAAEKCDKQILKLNDMLARCGFANQILNL